MNMYTTIAERIESGGDPARPGIFRTPAQSRNPLIVFDARWLFTGIGTYTFNVLSRINIIEPSIRLHALTKSEFASRLRPFCERVSILDVPIYTLREQFQVPWAARGANLLHIPHYNAPLLHRGCLVVTIHDLTHVLYRDYASDPKALFARALMKLVAKRADHLFTVSDYSKKCIVEYLGVPPDKVTVTYNGAAEEFRPKARYVALGEVQRTLGLDGPYILYVGNLKPHKNVSCLLRALAVIRDRRRLPHKLLVIGNDAKGKAALQELMLRLRIEDIVIFADTALQDSLLNAYCAADVVVMPSFEEGFGLPVIEAMACGTPVVCSRSAALPEVASDAAEYFDADSPEDLAEALDRVLNSTSRQTELRSNGLARAKSFTWEQCVEAHCSVYRELTS